MIQSKELLGKTILGIGCLCLLFWLGFVGCCFLALGSDGSLGAIIETGVYLLKHQPIVAGASIIAAIVAGTQLKKIL